MFVKLKRANQSCSPSKISQSINVGALVIDIVSNFFNERKKKLWSFDNARNVLIKKYRDMGSEKYISIRFRKISKLIRRAKE